jgi:hypothetical protein
MTYHRGRRGAQSLSRTEGTAIVRRARQEDLNPDWASNMPQRHADRHMPRMGSATPMLMPQKIPWPTPQTRITGVPASYCGTSGIRLCQYRRPRLQTRAHNPCRHTRKSAWSLPQSSYSTALMSSGNTALPVRDFKQPAGRWRKRSVAPHRRDNRIGS